jgi:hypothetical protein
MLFLTVDGRVLEDGRRWDGTPLRETDDEVAIQTIVIGARKTGLVSLLTVLPPRPDGARACANCEGRRWMTVPVTMVCSRCSGRGWEP